MTHRLKAQNLSIFYLALLISLGSNVSSVAKQMSFEDCVATSNGINNSLPTKISTDLTALKTYCVSRPPTVSFIYTFRSQKEALEINSNSNLYDTVCSSAVMHEMLRDVHSIIYYYSSENGKKLASFEFTTQNCQ
jgi:hypothetical protein